MFKELGYIKIEENEKFVEYRKDNDTDIYEINFWKEDKTISKNWYRDMGYISILELKAINKKCKELGWL